MTEEVKKEATVYGVNGWTDYGEKIGKDLYQRSRRVPRLTYWIRRAVNAWGIEARSERLASFSDL